MRILIGCLDLIDKEYYKEALQSYDVKFFSSGNADIVYQPHETSFLQISDQLPSNWDPDIVIFFHPEYQVLPLDIEKSPYPVIGLVSDWNLGFETINLVIGCFDYIFTDKRGAEMFQKMGISNIEYKPIYGFSPYYHRRYKNIEKIYDVSIIGNLNHKIQKERSKWLKRLTLLSPRYRIAILSGLYREEYALVVNQSKITFNRSIRKEMNMRAYEVPACGSLLFYEEENEEIRSVFQDRVHCVLYNEKNLEDLLDYYLTHDKEREQIINNAYKKIQKYSYEHQLKSIINRINEIGLENIKKIKRSFLDKPQTEQYNNHSRQAYLTGNIAGLVIAESKLFSAIKISPDNPEFLNNLGAVLARFTENVEQNNNVVKKEAELYFQQACKLFPDYALARLNLANFYIKTNQLDSAVHELKTIIEILTKDSKNALSIMGLYYPYEYKDFKVEWETILINHYNDPDMLYKAYEKLFFSKTYELLGDGYVRLEGEGELEENKKQRMDSVLTAYQNSLKFFTKGETFYKIGIIYRLLGNKEAAIENIYKALEYEPFILDAYLTLISLLFEPNKFPNFFKLLDEFMALSNAYLNYKDVFPYLLDKLILINSDSIYSHIKNQLNNILKRDFFDFYNPSISPAKIEDSKDYNFLYLWNKNWQIVINAYLNTFTGNNNIALIILIDPILYNKDNVQNMIADYIQNQLNVDLENIPDIVLFENALLAEDTPNLLKFANAFICMPKMPDVWYLASISMELPIIGTIMVYDNDYEPLKSIYTVPENFTAKDVSSAMLSVFSEGEKYNTSKAREIIIKRYKKSIDYLLNDYFYRLIIRHAHQQRALALCGQAK